MASRIQQPLGSGFGRATTAEAALADIPGTTIADMDLADLASVRRFARDMVALGWKSPDGMVPPQIAAMFKTPEAGAATTVRALTSDRLEGLGGLYCEDCDVAQAANDKGQPWERVRPWAVSEDGANRLWEMTEGWVASV